MQTIAKLEALQTGLVHSHFLDSGAYSLWDKSVKLTHASNQEAFFNSKEFWEYIDAYAKFVKNQRIGIDLYANIDVIQNPELSWRNQQYLEQKHGLHPVPVIHFKTDLKWLKHYLDRGYPIIGLGGVAKAKRNAVYYQWFDRCFNLVCDNATRIPCVKLHGFGITNYKMMIRYPWWSLDSASWCKKAAFGQILVPHKRGGRFVFDVPPYILTVSEDSPQRGKLGKHLLTLSKAEQAVLAEWLALIGLPQGNAANGQLGALRGVVTHYAERMAANLLFFELMRKSLPDWPWPFQPNQRKGFF